MEGGSASPPLLPAPILSGNRYLAAVPFVPRPQRLTLICVPAASRTAACRAAALGPIPATRCVSGAASRAWACRGSCLHHWRPAKNRGWLTPVREGPKKAPLGKGLKRPCGDRQPPTCSNLQRRFSELGEYQAPGFYAVSAQSSPSRFREVPESIIESTMGRQCASMGGSGRASSKLGEGSPFASESTPLG
jgi:hypothetical protein